MKREYLELLKEQFVHYTNQFKSNDIFVQQHFEVKQKHTFKVCENIVLLGQKAGLDDHQLMVAEIAALFHDIGRFEQYNQFHTFSDMESVNHAELGVQVINQNNFLKNLPDKEKKQVIQVILNHNIPFLPNDLDEEVLLLSKLLRDADKLDIFRVVMEYDLKESDFQVDESLYKIPDEILNAFNRRKIVELDYAKSKFDFFLLRTSWIFDINFQTSFQIIDQKGFLNYFLNQIPKSYRLMNIQNTVKEYMLEKIFTYA